MLFASFPSVAFGEKITKTITLSWDASIDADVIGYRVHYGQESGVYSHVLDAGNFLTSDIPNLIEGTTYYFVVTAYAADGRESVPSEEIHYLPNPALLLNLSARSLVQTGDNVLIGGFVVGGIGEKKIILRALGPSLAKSGIKGTLADPILELRDATGSLVVNDNWRTGQADELLSLGMAPTNEAEAATIVTLKAGNYTAIVRGKAGKSGVALLEVYDAGTPGD